MDSIFNISEAVSLALHATILLASKPSEQFSNKQIATRLGVSGAHLSKVLQRLSKFGIVKSTRGPKGGFILGMTGDRIKLIDVIEAIEGPFTLKHCLFEKPICNLSKCIFGDLLRSAGNQYHDYLSKTRLSDLTGFY